MPLTHRYANENLIAPTHADFNKKMFARVNWTHEAENKQQISVIAGEYVEVMDNTQDWWKVRGTNNKVGYIPGNYLVVVKLPEE
uniref:SH3 domain-containing protein n=1 Tax=Acrobeloides nanus TaxID=290746 RepID=A0A914DYC2_9BILA